MILKYTVLENNIYYNLKELLKNHFQISDRLLIKLKHEKKIFINGNISSINTVLNTGDEISVFIDFIEDNSNIIPTKMDIDIIYEDQALLVVNKPAGMPVHPSMDHFEDSLSNGVRYYFDQLGLKKKIRPVNRLDKDTSGIVVFAKNEYIQECLVKQMKTKEFEKEYIAICDGIFEKKAGIINAPIARKENSIIERCVSEAGDTAITHYEVIEECDTYSIIKCLLETGRTHQIRVHMAHIGHSLLGDTLYGTSSPLISRQALHAYRVSFIHPINKKPLNFVCEPPKDFKDI